MVQFFLGALAVLLALGVLYWRWTRRVRLELAEGAETEWAWLQKHEPALIEGIDRAQFDAIYARVNEPRFPKYFLGALAAFVVSLPLTFAALTGALMVAGMLGWIPEPAEIASRYLIDGDRMRLITAAPPEAAIYYARDLGGFYYFFGVLGVWLLIVAIFMRRYHAKRPGYLRDELLRAR